MAAEGHLPGLPDDLAIQCIARVPTFFHSILTHVSKSWNSLLQSPIFLSVRKALNLQEEHLFLCVRTPSFSYQWYTLHQHNSHRLCTPLPPMPSQPLGAACAVSHNKLFIMGGSVNETATSSVWAYDSHTKKWDPAPRMRVPREFSAAGAIDGKIYVMGGCQVNTWAGSTSWAEVFDPSTGDWSPVPSPAEMRERWMHGTAVLEGKLLAMADRGGVVFDSVDCSWNYVSTRLDNGWRGRAAVVDGILYSYDFLGKIRGYDLGMDRWLELHGLQKQLPKFLSGATLANVAGKLYVVWEGEGAKSNKQTDLLCAALEVRKEPHGCLRGTILWCQVILTLPRGASIIQCLSMEL